MSVLNGPNEGTWSVFAEKVVAERDAALQEVATLKMKNAEWSTKYDTLYQLYMALSSPPVQTPSGGKLVNCTQTFCNMCGGTVCNVCGRNRETCGHFVGAGAQ
jgi:hypothetical protein